MIVQMAQLPDPSSPDILPLDALEGDPFYGADLPSLIACLEPLPDAGMPVSPNNTPTPLFQVSRVLLCWQYHQDFNFDVKLDSLSY